MKWRYVCSSLLVTVLVFIGEQPVAAAYSANSYKTAKKKKGPLTGSAYIGTSTTRSLLECGNLCGTDSSCLAISYCWNGGLKQCHFHSTTTNNAFSGLDDDDSCAYTEITKTCQNGGSVTTKDGQCACPPFYTGTACEVYVTTTTTTTTTTTMTTTTTTTTEPTTTPAQCQTGQGYVLQNGRCFKFFPSPGKTHGDAQTYCQGIASHLFVIRSQSDVNMLLPHGSSTLNWVDGNLDLTWDNQALPWSTWVSYSPGQCTALCQADDGLETWDCSDLYGYFCELDI